MCRCTPSTAAPIIEEDRQTVRWRGRRCRKFEIPNTTSRSSNFNRVDRVRDNPGYRRVSVENGEYASLAHGLEMLAQMGLELCDTDSLHDYILVTTGHECLGRRFLGRTCSTALSS